MKINIDLDREELIALFNAISFEKHCLKNDIDALQENTYNLKNILDDNPNQPDVENIYQDIDKNEQDIEMIKSHILVLTTLEEELNKSLPK